MSVENTLTPYQMEMRKGKITGSRIAAICGLSPWATPLDVYLEMTDQAPPTPDNAAMERGRFLENGLRDWLAKRTGLHITDTGTVEHPEFDWIAATPDGAAFEGDKLVAAVEIKSPGPNTIRDWGKPEEQEDAIPSYVIPQCIWEAACLGAPETICSALIGGDLRTYRIEYSPKLFEVMVDKAAAFLTLVKTGNPPPLDGSDSAARWLADQFPSHIGVTFIQADDEIMGQITDLKIATERIKELDQAKALAQNMIKKWLGENPGLTSPLGKISWKSAARNQLKQKELVEWMKANHPEELSRFYEEKETRRFVATLK